MTESDERLWRRAQAHIADDQLLLARIVLEALLVRDRTHVRAHLLLHSLAWKEDRMRDSVRHAVDAARVAADDAELLVLVVSALLQVGECALARECLQRPSLDRVEHPDLLWRMAAFLYYLGDHPAAMQVFERARAAGADSQEFRSDFACQLSIVGRLQEAETEFEICAAMRTTVGRVYVELARLRRQTPEHNHLPLLDRQLALAASGSLDQAGIEFARYKELEDLGRYPEAWNALAHANDVMAARTRYDAALQERLYDRLRKVFPADFARAADFAQTGPMPIFVIGMPRSGTTLIERILGNHSQVRSAGELEDFDRQLRCVAGRCTQEMLDEQIIGRLPDLDYAELGGRYLAQTQWNACGKAYYVDKLPANWRLVGIIRRALPRARILNMVRDPMDVCFSNFRALFADANGWTYQLSNIAHCYGEYRKLMAHWHAVMPGEILDVSYADLVHDPESTAREAFSFCGLDYEEGCVDLRRNTAPIATQSLAQVRGGIHQGAFDEWRTYETQLAGLRLALTGVGLIGVD